MKTLVLILVILVSQILFQSYSEASLNPCDYCPQRKCNLCDEKTQAILDKFGKPAMKGSICGYCPSPNRCCPTGDAQGSLSCQAKC
uniref:Uncharacterized protein n=1 Tax=Acrobeloides nanus TaxID=290746 RepID=A0A914DIA3_9BILA